MAKILIVDDEAPLLRMVSQVLRKAGHEATVASSGQEALDLYDLTGHDLVIMDLIMPEMEGLEAIIELRKRNEDVPILAISGGGRGGMLGYLNIARTFGADETLSKPFSIDELRMTVESLLSPNKAVVAAS